MVILFEPKVEPSFLRQIIFKSPLIYSDYYYGLDLDFVGFKWDSGIKKLQIWLQNYISDKFKLNYGVNAIYYDFNPGTIKPSNSESGINFDQLDKKMLLNLLYTWVQQEVSKDFHLPMD
jgi:hypothetical protein